MSELRPLIEEVRPFQKPTSGQELDFGLTENSVPFVNDDGNLTEDPTGLSYVNGYLAVGTNNPAVSSGISLNGGRGTVEAALNGVTIRSGTTTGGAFDTTKRFRVFNGTNTPALIDIHTTGSGPYVHHVTLPIVLANGNFADDAAAQAGGLDIGDIYLSSGALRMRIA